MRAPATKSGPFIRRGQIWFWGLVNDLLVREHATIGAGERRPSSGPERKRRIANSPKPVAGKPYPLNKHFHHINDLDDFLILLPLTKSRRWNHYGILRERNCGSRPESFALLISVRWLIGPSGQFLFPEQLHIRSVGARHDPPATLALDRGGAARRAEPKGRLDDLEVVKPQKAK